MASYLCGRTRRAPHRVRPPLWPAGCQSQTAMTVDVKTGGARARRRGQRWTYALAAPRQLIDHALRYLAGSRERLTLTGCRSLLDRVQHPMTRDRVVERGAQMRSLAIVGS